MEVAAHGTALQGVNDTHRPLKPDACLHVLFAAHAERSPDAPAVVSDGHAVSYARLAAWAEGIAGRLTAAGVERGDMVGVCGTPSPAVIAAILGILRCGAAYVPLEPDWPRERLRFMAEDCGLRLVVCDAEHAELAASLGAEAVPAEESADSPEPGPAPATDPGELAYVLYTSGSTGAPKGVAIPHRAVNRLISGAPDYVELGPECRFLWLSPLTFDASVIELWGPLLTGGAIVVMPPGQPWLERISETIRGDRVTAALFISPQLHMIVDRDPHELEGMRHVLVGGDVLSAEHVRRLLASGVVVEVVHCYGPTESTLFATVDVIREVDPEETALPIGRPIENTTCHVVDDELRPLGVGEQGELLIGGLGLAQGYVNRPELTAEKFVPDPFSEPGSGARLYRTGDLARWRQDGRLDFLGRMDHQVKIRGYRIELAEIEATLRDHEAIDDCVVLAREDEPGLKRLVAYVVARRPVRVAELRDFVAGRLPAYMIPAAWVTLDALPLTANNKVDRAALPAPGGAPAPSGNEPPQGELETRIADLFAEILRVDAVGRDDDFFELGGDSLLATDVIARLNQHADVRLPLDVLVGASTPAALAREVEGGAGARPAQPLPPLVRRPPAETGPVSVSQEQISFLCELDPASLAYQFQAIIWLNGDLDRAALNEGLSGIVARHEIYRTTFGSREGTRLAQVHEPFRVELEADDLSTAADPDAALEELAAEQFSRRIGIESLPLARWRLARLGPNRHALLHAEHHLVHDGWSMMNFLRELRELYAAAVEDRPARLTEPRIQFTDFAAWQRELLETDLARDQLAYWGERLADPPDPLDLPHDLPRPEGQTFNGDQVCFELGRDLAERVRSFAREEGVTPFMTMFAAFAALLHRSSGATDLIVGSGLANRRLPELEDALGMFINTVALRVDLSGDPTVAELLERVRARVLEAQANQDVPFPRVVEAVGPARTASHAPLYQTLFSFADASLPELSAPGLEIVPDETPGNGSAKADVNVVVVNHGRPAERSEGELTVVWEYNSDLFSPEAAERMADDYRVLLDALVASPQSPVSELPLRPEAERRPVPADWNDTATPYPRDSTIHELFAEVVRRDPDAVAVVSAESEMTYGELDRLANGLAEGLRAQGVAPGARVGIALERSPEMVVALLGVLKAGAAYVPLDPSDPPQRRDFIARDAEIALVLDAQTAAPADGQGAAPPVPATADAYVMYTSGSTGEPKGVVVTHRNVVRLVSGQTYAAFGPDEVFMQMAPLAFDASTFEIWGALLHGAKLVLYPGGPIDLAELRVTLERHDVTTLWLTAALFHQVVDGDIGALSGLKQLLAGGDVLLPDRVARVRLELPGLRLVNGYGPTEATTFSCCFDTTSGASFSDSVPIGRPIANTTAHVLDSELRPVPVGVAGELHIGGEGVARGYANRPELTAERFVPDPFRGLENRLYKTGDVARWRADGQLEFLGREDFQVKVRGFRVEPGEVEAALAAHPGVREAAVVAPQEPDGDRRLVAHFAGAPDLGTDDLRRFLGEKLPSYMVPSAFARVDVLPVTPNGKVDRAALAAAGHPRAIGEAQGATEYPRASTEEVIAGVWAEVLGLDAVGPEDDFFASGGHSLLALKVIHDLNEAFEIDLPVRSLLMAPTVAELAREVERARDG